ncbi:MAG TPA: MerR family transcriptional regulator [Hyphomicrobiaceae bacterium]|nr:MerR family transcriptional regulator [Hyphomicrobiaceae bacterium]
MAKSADAFRTISEVSTELDVPKHVLRFWEQRFKQLKPLKRGGGRRFYRPEDVELIKGIKTLLNRDAYTIRGVQRILKEQGTEIVKRLATGDTTALLAAVPPATEASPSTASKGRRPAAARKSRRARPDALHADRDVVEAAISELSACRALLAGETLRTKAPLAASGASSRR